MQFILLGTSACHLCEQAQQLWINLKSQYPKLNLTVIDIIDHAEWQDEYQLKIPVIIHLDSHQELAWPFNQQQLSQFIMNTTLFRTEIDSMGALQVPIQALYGAQTQRAINNFSISDLVMPASFIKTVALIKKIAAIVNAELGELAEIPAQAIIKAADQIIAGEYADQFPIDVFQTGSATSTNMNVNEVIAHLASDICGQTIHANDQVNCGQSSNDVIPTAIHISAVLECHRHLLPNLNYLAEKIELKAKNLDHIIKTGRTHLMDAMPLRFSQELNAWAYQIRQGIQRIQATLPRLYALAQGGTAVGTGINAHPQFAQKFTQQLTLISGLPFKNNDSFFESLSCQDSIVELSGQCKVIAVSLMKIANDLRWMNSGPLAGLGEIELPALQPGSSIMPGKVNPVIPEATAMVAAQVIGNDTTITIAGQSGNFQLNVMLPLIAYNILQSIGLLANASKLLADQAISDFKVCESNIQQALAKNPILVTALNPIIGYAKA
ncbi:MAG: aspartate ammonia-lyase, partial [Pseudomonadota bacterium]